MDYLRVAAYANLIRIATIAESKINQIELIHTVIRISVYSSDIFQKAELKIKVERILKKRENRRHERDLRLGSDVERRRITRD